MAHYGTALGCVFRKNDQPYSPDFAAIARAYGVEGVQIKSAEEFKPTLEGAIKAGRPFVIDVAMMNEPGTDRRTLEYQRDLLSRSQG